MTDLDDFRRAKDEWMATDEQSPLTATQRPGFTHLAYFDENPALVLAVEPEPFERIDSIEMQTSSGEFASFERWARVHFTIDGEEAALTVYRQADDEHLFLPFADATSGRETYGAGRYVEVQDLEDGRVLIDFNYAYNPYCAYNEGYSCPLPPAENRLAVAIRAGETNFPGTTAEHRH